MDQRLHDRLTAWHSHIEVLEKAELAFLTLEANEKPMYSSLFLRAEGKTSAEREARAYDSQEWRDFTAGLVHAKADYLKKKRLLELKQSAFNAEYLGAKNQGEAVQRMPRAVT